MNNITKSENSWWKKTVVYQIYLRSFYDLNGDKIGELIVIISKLNYILDLEIDTIWFSPYFSGSQREFGYDITYIYGIDPQYIDMKLSDKLKKEIHKRDMKVVLGLVLNHTSDQHPWFIESRFSRDSPKILIPF